MTNRRHGFFELDERSIHNPGKEGPAFFFTSRLNDSVHLHKHLHRGVFSNLSLYHISFPCSSLHSLQYLNIPLAVMPLCSSDLDLSCPSERKKKYSLCPLYWAHQTEYTFGSWCFWQSIDRYDTLHNWWAGTQCIRKMHP